MNTLENHPVEDDAQESRSGEHKSKTQVKKQMHMLTELGAKLVGLSDRQRRRMPMGEALAQAVDEARRIQSFSARKRQIKFIGRLLRNENVEPLIQALRDVENEGRSHAEKERRITRWRDRLLEEGDTALSDLLAQYPELDRQHLRQLIRNAAREKTHGKPPASSRALLRYLRAPL